MSKKEEVSDTKIDETIAPGAATAATQETEDLVEVYIDPVATDGGLMTNDKRYVGRVKVPAHVAEDIMRRIAEYAEVKNLLNNPRQKIRIKNHYVIEKMYLADPSENSMKPGWTREYGMLDPWQWQHLTPVAQKEMKELRFALYGI